MKEGHDLTNVPAEDRIAADAFYLISTVTPATKGQVADNAVFAVAFTRFSRTMLSFRVALQKNPIKSKVTQSDKSRCI